MSIFGCKRLKHCVLAPGYVSSRIACCMKACIIIFSAGMQEARTSWESSRLTQNGTRVLWGNPLGPAAFVLSLSIRPGQTGPRTCSGSVNSIICRVSCQWEARRWGTINKPCRCHCKSLFDLARFLNLCDPVLRLRRFDPRRWILNQDWLQESGLPHTSVGGLLYSYLKSIEMCNLWY